MKRRFFLLLLTVLLSGILIGQNATLFSHSNNELKTIGMSTTVIQNSVNNEFDVLLNDRFGLAGPSLNYPITFKNNQLVIKSTKGGMATIDDNGTPLNLIDDRIRYTPKNEFVGVDVIEYQIQNKEGKFQKGKISIHVIRLRSSDSDETIVTENEYVFKIYPNPSKGVIDITIQSPKNRATTFEVFDVRGKLITSFNKEIEVGLNNFQYNLKVSSGIYILRYSDANTTKRNRKIIIQ